MGETEQNSVLEGQKKSDSTIVTLERGTVGAGYVEQLGVR